MFLFVVSPGKMMCKAKNVNLWPSRAGRIFFLNPLLSPWPCKYYFTDVTLRNNSSQNSAYVFGLTIWSNQKADRDMKDKHPQRKSLNLVFISTIMNTGTYSYLKWHSVLLKLISQYRESRDRTDSYFSFFLSFPEQTAWRTAIAADTCQVFQCKSSHQMQL